MLRSSVEVEAYVPTLVDVLKESWTAERRAWRMCRWPFPRTLQKCKWKISDFHSLQKLEKSFSICYSRMEQNYITEIPAKAFTNYRRLRRIDLSNNNISRIAYDAFSGLKSLNSLVLYGNKIKELPAGVFKGLTSLQLLLLNANEISCIRKDSFKDLSSLSLLSLYDNNIQSLSNGTFEALKQIQTM